MNKSSLMRSKHPSPSTSALSITFCDKYHLAWIHRSAESAIPTRRIFMSLRLSFMVSLYLLSRHLRKMNINYFNFIIMIPVGVSPYRAITQTLAVQNIIKTHYANTTINCSKLKRRLFNSLFAVNVINSDAHDPTKTSKFNDEKVMLNLEVKAKSKNQTNTQTNGASPDPHRFTFIFTQPVKFSS